jgi:hypothetical protein
MTDQDLRDVERALTDYAGRTQGTPPPGFADWVMRSVAIEPLPRRGVLVSLAALLALPGPHRRAAQVVALALILFAGIGSAVVLGGLADNDHGPSPSPVPTVEASASPEPTPAPSALPSPTPTPTPTAAPTPLASPHESEDEDETPEPAETPES